MFFDPKISPTHFALLTDQIYPSYQFLRRPSHPSVHFVVLVIKTVPFRNDANIQSVLNLNTKLVSTVQKPGP